MSRTEKVEFTNMCMVCNGSKIVVIDRQKKDWAGVTFPGGHVELCIGTKTDVDTLMS